MNIYRKKIVKEKEYIFNEDCVQTKSTNPNSKPDNESDISSNLNIRKFYGINSTKIKKNEKTEKNNRNYRSKSQILDNKEIIKKYTPKAIKTVLIKFKKPLEQNNNIGNLNYKTYYSNKFYKPKETNINNIKNEFKALEIECSLNNIQNLINYYNSNTNNPSSFFIPSKVNKPKKLTRNKSVMLNNKFINIDNENNNMNVSFNTIYKKNYCLDKHKNFGGNFKNKKRSNTNYKININKSNSYIKNDKNLILNNISSLDIKNSFISRINYENSHAINFPKINNNKNNGNRKDNNNIQYNLSIIKDKTNNIDDINDFIYINENKEEKRFNIDIKKCKNKEDASLKNNKLKKYIPPLNIKNNIQNSNIIDIKVLSQKKVHNNKYLNMDNIANQINLAKYKNNDNIITFEEPVTDKYSIKKNKINLVNLINISEQYTKRDSDNNRRKSEKNNIDNYLNKMENNKTNIKIKKNNSKKVNAQKEKGKIKKKAYRTDSTRKIETDNISYNINNINKIKSIPLKLNNLNNMFTNERNNFNKCTNIFSNPNDNKINKNEIDENVVIIGKNDFRLWKDLTRIYDNIAKYQ